MRLTIEGKPIAKKRPRFRRIGNYVRTYSDQGKEVSAVRRQIRSQYKGEPLEGAVSIHLWFDMPIPKSTSKKRTQELIGTFHTKKPDLDNLVKFIKDCMNGIVYKDDSQVANIRASKSYSDYPATDISIVKL